MHNFMLLDRSEEECGMIMEKYRHYRIPDEFIVNVEDGIIVKLMEDLSLMITSPEDSEIKHFGLNYTGITIIPPVSLSYFQNVFLKKKLAKKSAGVYDLIVLISKAIKENKSIIHYGIKRIIFIYSAIYFFSI